MADKAHSARWVARASLYVAGSSLLGLAVPTLMAADVAGDLGYATRLYADAWARPLAALAFVAGTLLAGVAGYRLASSGRDLRAIGVAGALAIVAYAASARIAFATPDVLAIVFWGFPGLAFTALAPAWLAWRDAERVTAARLRAA